MVLDRVKLKNKERTFEAIFVGLVERSDMLSVIDSKNGAQKVSTVQRLSESQGEAGDIMALCGLPWRPKTDEPTWDGVPARVSAWPKATARLARCAEAEGSRGREPTCVHSQAQGTSKVWVH